MLINQHTAVNTRKVLLVPYEESHVITYHEWMKDEEIQALTASEPLTIDEEYAMQKSWRSDHDKLTFIICTPHSTKEDGNIVFQKDVSDAPSKMIGDINLFLTPADEDEEGCIGEIELMIAPVEARSNGYGRAAVLVFMEYLRRNLEGVLEEYKNGIDRESKERGGKMKLLQLRVKIGSKNLKSIRLFESLGFVRVGEGENYFGEVELVFEGWVDSAEGLMERWGLGGYRECGFK